MAMPHMVEDGAFSHKKDYVNILRGFLIWGGIQIALLVQELWQFC